MKNEYTPYDISTALIQCVKRKRHSSGAEEFYSRLYENTATLLHEINTETYEISPSIVFVVNKPKVREVWCGQFRDRIVHHLVCNDIASHFLSKCVEGNSACIPQRGTLYAINHVIRDIRKCSQNHAKTTHILQLDISNFFVSIDRTILWDLIRKDIGEDTLTSRLVRKIIFNDVRKNVIKRGRGFDAVPYKKSLFHCDNMHGLPIGNLTSQVFSGYIYLNELDQFIKSLGVKHYTRYVDDMILVSSSRDFLVHCEEQISQFLGDKLCLELNRNKTKLITDYDRIDFAGRIIHPWYTRPRRRNIASAFEAASEKRTESLNSYIADFKHSQSFSLINNLKNIYVSK